MYYLIKLLKLLILQDFKWLVSISQLIVYYDIMDISENTTSNLSKCIYDNNWRQSHDTDIFIFHYDSQ